MSQTVLIIDDSALVLQMLEMVCQEAGYETIACSSFADVRAELTTESPDIIITDLNMPGLEGRDPVSALRADFDLEGVPIIVVSGLEADELQTRAAEIGANGFASKDEGMPGLQKALPEMLQRLLDQ
ncbi:MAG: response regulator [Myxococcota bacterium]